MSRNSTSYSTEGWALPSKLVECLPSAHTGAAAHIWNRSVVIRPRASLSLYQVSGQPGLCKVLSQVTQYYYVMLYITSMLVADI